VQLFDDGGKTATRLVEVVKAFSQGRLLFGLIALVYGFVPDGPRRTSIAKLLRKFAWSHTTVLLIVTHPGVAHSKGSRRRKAWLQSRVLVEEVNINAGEKIGVVESSDICQLPQKYHSSGGRCS